MKISRKDQDALPPRGKILKEAATGQEREQALQKIREISQRAGARVKALGMTEADIHNLIYEP